MARTQVDLSLLICSENRHAKTDVCIVDCSQNDTILLIVQKDRGLEHWVPDIARAQLIVEAVAAFNQNNAQRDEAARPPLAEKVSHFVNLLTLF